jgi:hypothetical protein
MILIFTIIAVIVAIIAFVITWLVSEFFIPPRDHWTKSGFAIFTIKLGMAATAAFYAFLFIYTIFGVTN